MSQESKILVNFHRRRCISRVPLRNTRGMTESVGVGGENIRPDKLLKELATGYRISVVFTVGGPLVYQPQSDQFA
jgi:hypothetical protein